MKGWIEVHTEEGGKAVSVNIANVTSVMDNQIFLLQENRDPDGSFPGNIKTRETYEEIKTMIWEAQR